MLNVTRYNGFKIVLGLLQLKVVYLKNTTFTFSHLAFNNLDFWFYDD